MGRKKMRGSTKRIGRISRSFKFRHACYRARDFGSDDMPPPSLHYVNLARFGFSPGRCCYAHAVIIEIGLRYEKGAGG